MRSSHLSLPSRSLFFSLFFHAFATLTFFPHLSYPWNAEKNRFESTSLRKRVEQPTNRASNSEIAVTSRVRTDARLANSVARLLTSGGYYTSPSAHGGNTMHPPSSANRTPFAQAAQFSRYSLIRTSDIALIERGCRANRIMPDKNYHN